MGGGHNVSPSSSQNVFEAYVQTAEFGTMGRAPVQL
jgi:hypothetical protein